MILIDLPKGCGYSVEVTCTATQEVVEDQKFSKQLVKPGENLTIISFEYIRSVKMTRKFGAV